MAKERFIKALAKYLVGNQAEMSIKLQMGKPEAKTWAEMRSATPLQGYPTVDEAEEVLERWLT